MSLFPMVLEEVKQKEKLTWFCFSNHAVFTVILTPPAKLLKLSSFASVPHRTLTREELALQCLWQGLWKENRKKQKKRTKLWFQYSVFIGLLVPCIWLGWGKWRVLFTSLMFISGSYGLGFCIVLVFKCLKSAWRHLEIGFFLCLPFSIRSAAKG